MKKRLFTLLALVLTASMLFAGGEGEKSESAAPAGDQYSQVMARFTGKLEKGAVVKVLENDTAIELGYVDQLIEAFNAEYADKGIQAERMNIDQYSDLATDGPYGYGPDVWYQANDIIMKYATKRHMLPLPVRELEAQSQIPQNAWNAYAVDMNGEKFYCGVPLNVQSGMLYYIESMLPENWKTDWDLNKNDVPDFFETYTALYAYSEDVKKNGGTTEYGYLDDLVDTYFMAGYLFTNGAYIFGNDGTDPDDIGLNKGNAAIGTNMIRQWAAEMNNTEVLDKTFASAAYQYLADGKMLCTISTPDVYRMFTRAMVNTGKWTEETAEKDLKMITVPNLPKSNDLTADKWQDTILQKDELTVPVNMMGGINGYGMSAYTKCPNASLEFIKFATSYEQAVIRNQYLGIAPARQDSAKKVAETDATVGILFDRLNSGLITLMPAINEIGQVWTPAESFFIDLTTDPFRVERGEPVLYDTIEKIQAGLNRLVQQIYDAINTLA